MCVCVRDMARERDRNDERTRREKERICFFPFSNYLTIHSKSIKIFFFFLLLATIIGGIIGNVLGTYSTDWLKYRIKNAAYLVSAIYCIPCAIFMFIAINYTSNFWGMAILLIIAEVFAFTNTGPITDVSITCIPSHLR